MKNNLIKWQSVKTGQVTMARIKIDDLWHQLYQVADKEDASRIPLSYVQLKEDLFVHIPDNIDTVDVLIVQYHNETLKRPKR